MSFDMQCPEVVTEVRGGVGLITLNRPKALNALNLPMVRALTAALRHWQADDAVQAVAIRGIGKEGPFGAFCAGGDIRFFHAAALSGDPALEDFFTEEYALNHLIHTYGKPYIAFMDGIVMGGGMGVSQGASHRIVTGRTKMAMPETGIGQFPDVGGGYFLSRCPGRIGEWLALTGELLDGEGAVAAGLADRVFAPTSLQSAWDGLTLLDWQDSNSLESWIAMHSIALTAYSIRARGQIDSIFAASDIFGIFAALESDGSEWAQATLATLQKRSPLMLHVVLAQIRRGRDMGLADELRMERDMVRHCFVTRHLDRQGARSETVEGIRALAVDKDHQPQWAPASIHEVNTAMVTPFFASPWPAAAHPLRDLA
ncbi:enoyl-CoA hydratase/isomerase family protein [Rhodoferax sp.]|uniref:enoyl-CoA hydratase/isomerase family protein n=1 Tax=Rhodoferax sp. TaxID=50421 RepID=UPI0025CD2DA0|nr:enoyl-CoA hydratase/isomerase family protein [Rhodoferax sp.]